MAFKTIGILGGIGPESTAAFYQKIIEICHNKYKAVQDTDYPPMFIYSLPLEGFDETGIVNKEQVLKQLIKGVQKLEEAGSDLIVIPCNTVHYFIEELRNSINIPILSLVEETVAKLENIKKVGLLASESTYQLGVYDKIFDKYGIKFMTPKQAEMKLISKIILNVMSGKSTIQDKQVLLNLMNNMKNKGVEAIVIGCTELPLIISQKDCTLKIYDSLQILAESAVEESRIIKELKLIEL